MKVGLIGCGPWGKLILRDLKAMGCHVAVVARTPSSLDNARTTGADAVVPSVEDLPAVEGFVVAVRTSDHAEAIFPLLDRNVPVFCEKPLTCDVASARDIVAKAGDRVFVMDKWRYHPGVHALRDIAQSGELGPVLGIKSQRLQWGHGHDDVAMSWTLLPHDLAIALEILGELPAPVHAVAESDAEGLMTLTAWLAGAAWLHCEAGIRYPQHHRRVEVRCRDGIAVLADAYDEHVAVLRSQSRARHTAPPEWERRSFVPCMPLYAELLAFKAYVEGRGPPPKSSAAEALRAVEAIAEMHRLAGIA